MKRETNSNLENLLADLYAYVDDVRAFKTGEEHDADIPPDIVMKRPIDTHEEESLKARILDAMQYREEEW